MALRKRGEWRYGDSQADIRDEIVRYSKGVTYLAEHFADAVCSCGGRVFALFADDTHGVASRVCSACDADPHYIGDGADFAEDAEEEECACPCGQEAFEVTVGIALYEGSEDVKWFYLGCRCVSCGLTAVYGDWKNEYNDYRVFLSRV